MSGTSYYGINDSSNAPDAYSLCGTIQVSATVSMQEFPSDVINLYSGPTATYSAQQETAYLAQYAQLIYDTQLKAYASMLGVYQPIAQGLATGQYTTPDLTSDTAQAPLGATVAAGNAYAQLMGQLIIPQFNQAPSPVNNTIGGYITTAVNVATQPITYFSTGIQDAVTQGLDAGWVSAGSFYFILNRSFIGKLFASAGAAYNATNYNMPTCGDPDGTCYQVMKTYSSDSPVQADNATNINNLLSTASTTLGQPSDQATLAVNLYDVFLYDQIDQTTNISGRLNFTSDPSGATSYILQGFSDLNTEIINTMSGIFTGQSSNMDPLLAHAVFGRAIMVTCEATFILILAKLAKFKTPSSNETKDIYNLGTQFFLFAVSTLLLPFLGFLWSFGAVLAIYCPLIPFMFFTFGALGWYIIVVEAVIGAPIIAIGLLLPGGEEFGRTTGALAILASLFFRPALMILGFLFAATVYKAAVQLVDFGMGSIFETISFASLFSSLVLLAVYVTFIMSVTNICFAFIYELPNKILRWLGAKEEEISLGDIAQVHSAAESTGHKVGQAGEQLGNKGVASIHKKLAEAYKKALKGGGGSGGSTGGSTGGGTGTPT